MAKPQLWILEGVWWQNREAPHVLPYFEALQRSHGPLALAHKSFRSAEDIEFWVKRISKNASVFLYFACHGSNLDLQPVDGRSSIHREDLLAALKCAKPGAIAFLHFGCCEMVDASNRRATLNELAEACGARWVSGYTESVDWLQSTLIDLAVVGDLYIPYHRMKRPQIRPRAKKFVTRYEQLARELGFSGLATDSAGTGWLVPQRLHKK